MQFACAVLSYVVCPALQYFPTCRKRHDFRYKILPNIKCVFWFYLQLSSETFVVLIRVERDAIKNNILVVT